MIYLDHAAAVPMRECAVREMLRAARENWGNPSASYGPARSARAELNRARDILADTIGARWDEIYFTSGGSESDNWALIGAMETAGDRRHLIVSAIEHHAVLHTCAYLESRGFSVTLLSPDAEGRIRADDLESALKEHPDTALVSVMAANNEIGTIEEIGALAETAHRYGALFHTDAVQAYCKIPINVRDLSVDLLSASAHKIGGPRGIGFLYLRQGVNIQGFIHGGPQERGRRAGTENTAGAAGFAAAAAEANAMREEDAKKERSLQEYYFHRLKESFGDCGMIWNGPLPGKERLPGNISVSFPGRTSDALLISLDFAGICASSGSACTTGAVTPSHVIMALSGDEARAKGTLRFTIGPENTEEEAETVIKTLKEALQRGKKHL